MPFNNCGPCRLCNAGILIGVGVAAPPLLHLALDEPKLVGGDPVRKILYALLRVGVSRPRGGQSVARETPPAQHARETGYARRGLQNSIPAHEFGILDVELDAVVIIVRVKSEHLLPSIYNP
jgi:hypothetical protein